MLTNLVSVSETNPNKKTDTETSNACLKEMPTTDLLGVALVAPDKAKHFYSHGLRLVRLTYFTQMGLAALIRLNMRTAQLAKRRLRPLPLPGVEGERRAVISRLLSLALN